MQFVRRGNIDRLDLRVGAEFLDRRVGLAAKIRGECRTRLRARIGAGDQFDPRMELECRQHQAEGAAKTDRAEAKFVVVMGVYGRLVHFPA